MVPTTPRVFLVFVATLLFVHPSPAATQEKPRFGAKIGRAPEWVHVFTNKINRVSLQSNETLGQAILLLDYQVNVDSGESYMRFSKQLLNETGVQQGSQLSITFDPSYQELILHNVSVIRGTNRINQLDANKFKLLQQEKELDRHIYNGNWSAVSLLEDIRPGDILDYSYTLRGRNPISDNRFAETFTTQWDIPIQNQRYRILCPESRTLAINTEGTTAQPKITQLDGQREYVWKWSSVPALVTEEGTPFWFRTQPMIQVSEYATWADVAQWACKLYGMPAEISPELKNSMKLWRMNQHPEVRAVAALQFVQDQIRYMGIEFGPHSHEPSDPSTVYARRFGDCKDKALLLCTMLRELDVTAKPVLVNSVARRSIETWQPSPFVFNHVVVQLQIGDKTLYVDPTVSQQRGGLKARYFPDYRFGLVVDPETTALTFIPPFQTGVPNTKITETYTFVGTNGQVFLKVKTHATGWDADNVRRSVASTSKATFDKSYLNYYAPAYPAIEMVSSVKVYDDESANAVDTEENYRIPKIWTTMRDGRIGCSFLARSIRDVLVSPVHETRTAPYAIFQPANRDQTIEIVYNDKWHVKPDRQKVFNEFFQFTSETATNHDHTTFHCTYHSLTDVVPPQKIANYRSDIERVTENLTFGLTKPVVTVGSRDPNWAILGIGLFFGMLVTGGSVFVYRYRPVAPPLVINDADKQLEGLGGWLVVVCIGLISGVITRFATFANSWHVYSLGTWQALTMPGSPDYHALWAPTLIFELLLQIGTGLFCLLVLVLFFEKRRLFPTMFVTLLALQAVGVAIDSALAYMIKPGHTQLSNPVVMLLGAIVWGSYMLNSRRVKVTFVR